MQLALAFGHIHAKDVLGETHSSAPIDASVLASLSNEHRASAPADADGSHHHHEDEYCAIYAINGLIASAQHAEPPTLVMPLRIGRAQHTVGFPGRARSRP